MNPSDLFKCTSLLKSLNEEMNDGDSERLVILPKPSVSQALSPTPNDLPHVETTGEESSILIDPHTIPDCEQPMTFLERHGLLEQDVHDRVKMITVKLHDEIAELNADLSINREVIQSLEEFEMVQEIWDRLEVDPLNSFSWNLSWWNAFQTHGDLRLIKFERDGTVVGLAPFYVDRWFGLTRLRFLASGDACTDYVDLICAPEHYGSCTYSLAEYIREKKFDVVELECTKDDRLAVLLKQHLDGNYSFDHRAVEPTWRLTLPDSWEEFVAGTKKSLRRKINKAVRRLESGEFTISSSAEIPVGFAFQTLKDLHTRRFNSMGKPGVFADKKFEKFLRSAVTEFSLDGRSEIVIVSHNGSAIASQLYFDSTQGYQLYQSGYHPDSMKLEPGHLLFTSMVKKAIERGDRFFDFLRGNEVYKEFWGAEPHVQNKLRMISKGVLPTVVAKVVETGRSLFRSN